MKNKTTNVRRILGQEEELLDYECEAISKERLYVPGPDFVDRAWGQSDRSPRVRRNMQAFFNHGRLGGTGYLSILPVDHGISFSAGSAFAPNPRYFDPREIVRLVLEGGCNGVITTFGVLGSVAEEFAHKIPLLLKLNHHETLSYPNEPDQIFFSRVEEAFDMGCAGVGATIYFGSQESKRQIQEVSEAFSQAHELGMFTILFCYLNNSAFRTEEANYEYAADLTGQANHLGATIEADFIKQKQPTVNGGYKKFDMGSSGYGEVDERMYSLVSDHPIAITRYQVANSYMGRCGLINSGGASGGSDLKQAVRAAVVNKRAGGMGLISGRKAFQKTMEEGIKILHAIQDVYLDDQVTIA